MNTKIMITMLVLVSLLVFAADKIVSDNINKINPEDLQKFLEKNNASSIDDVVEKQISLEKSGLLASECQQMILEWESKDDIDSLELARNSLLEIRGVQ